MNVAQTIDLVQIKERLRRKKNFLWKFKNNVDKLEKEYKEFLQYKVDNPDVKISPSSQAVDDMWHEHILDTAKYFEDCNKLFGHYLHHTPAKVFCNTCNGGCHEGKPSCDTCQGGCSDGGFCSGQCY